jgi:drug/metabolite transporter (DMT)-like permease
MLALPLCGVLAGLLLINLSRGSTFDGNTRFSVLGIACLLLPVAMWTWYAVANAAFLKRRPDISATEWASVIGVATFALTVSLLAAELWFGTAADSAVRLVSTGQWVAFSGWSIVLGAGASWGAAALFNKASARLPVALTGQLIVFETVFGVVYVFLAEGRPPKSIEFAGFALAIAGIWLCIRILHPRVSKNRTQETGAAAQLPVTWAAKRLLHSKEPGSRHELGG